jgi:hypothetical protein
MVASTRRHSVSARGKSNSLVDDAISMSVEVMLLPLGGRRSPRSAEAGRSGSHPEGGVGCTSYRGSVGSSRTPTTMPSLSFNTTRRCRARAFDANETRSAISWRVVDGAERAKNAQLSGLARRKRVNARDNASAAAYK